MLINSKVKKVIPPMERKLRTVGMKTFVALFPVRYDLIQISQTLKATTYSNRKVTNKLYSQNGINYKKNAMLWLTENNCEKSVLKKIIASKRVPQNIKSQARIYYNTLT